MSGRTGGAAVASDVRLAMTVERLSQCAGVLDAVRGRVGTVAAPDVPVPPTPVLEQQTRPSVPRILAAIEAVIAR